MILHVDTGMARLGLSALELARLRNNSALLDGVRVEYVMTHLACADIPDDPMNARQAAAFAAAMRQFPGAKTSFANSSGMFLGPAFGPTWPARGRPCTASIPAPAGAKIRCGWCCG